MAFHERVTDKREVPRWFLIGALNLFLLVVGWFEVGWRMDVNTHVAKSVDDLARLVRVETHAKEVNGSIEGLRSELKDMRKDQLEFYRWQVERAGDNERAKQFKQRLEMVNGQR